MRLLCSRKLLFAIVGIGIVLRVAQYLANRSLWADEAWLALNLVSRSLVGLTKPLDFAQAAPPGFLFMEHGIARALGFSEYALRLFPLLCGVASVVAFACLARRALAAAAAPLAVFIFAVSDGLIYYSSELKPYAVDVAVSIVLILVGLNLAKHSPRVFTTVMLALAGLASILFSFPAVFLVAAITAAFLIRTALQQAAAPRPRDVLVMAVWTIASLGVAAFAASRALDIWSSNGERFLGLGGTSSVFDAADFFGTNLAAAIGFVREPPFNQLQKPALILVLAGVVSLLRRDKLLLSVLVAPFALTFAASAAGVYPLSLRTELFLVPSLILLLAEGVHAVVGWAPGRWKPAAAVALSLAVVAGPAVVAAKRLLHPRHREELRPVLAFVQRHWRPGDALYVHNYAQYGFLYYERCGCLNPNHDGRALWPVRAVRSRNEFGPAAVSLTPALIIGKYHGRKWPRYVADLRRLKGRGRVWFVYSHYASPEEGAFIRRKLVGTLDSMGTRLMQVDRLRAHGYLYDLK